MRTKNAKIRPIKPDPLYGSPQVTRLINRIMRQGKKTVAQTQVYRALDVVKEKTEKPPLDTFEQALNNILPKMEVRSRRVGGAAYQVPMPVRNHRALSLAMRWLVIEATKRPSTQYHTFADKLAAEIIDAAAGQGGAIQKKVTAHKMAEANKAFAHFRW